MTAQLLGPLLTVAAVALVLALVVPAVLAAPRTVVVDCPGGVNGFESGYVVAVMPPDVVKPTGGLTQPAGEKVRRLLQ